MEKRNNYALSQLPPPLQDPHIPHMIELALREDLTPDQELPLELVRFDATSAGTLPPYLTLNGKIFAKQDGIVAGLPVAAAVFKFVDPALNVEILVDDGARIEHGALLMRVSGPGRAMLIAERTALNFLGRMSGVSTLTRRFVDAIVGTNAAMLDTRKTAPGFRLLDKYAVRMGGGNNHRMGLYDMALIKDNHIDGAGSLEAAVAGVREKFGDSLPIEIEVKDLDEFDTALTLPVDRVMLDNMSLDDMREAVRRRDSRSFLSGPRPEGEGSRRAKGGEGPTSRIKLEASGNVSLETVRAIAETGVDYISSGALTHSVPVFDISMRLENEPKDVD